MTERDLARIAFLTTRQAELRGLREVAFALYICAVMTLILLARRSPERFDWMTVLIFSIVIQEAAMQLIDWRYNSTYGRVNEKRGLWARPTRAQSVIGLGIAFDITPWFPFAGVSAFPLVVAIYGLWIATRDFPWRAHHLAGILLLLAAPRVDDPTRMLNHFPAYFAGAGCLVLTGLCDHLVLARAMSRLRRQAAPDTSA